MSTARNGFLDTHNGTSTFKPPLNELNPDVEAAFSSVAGLLAGLAAPEKLKSLPWYNPDVYVDARDVALAFVKSLSVESAANQRFNLIAGDFSWEAACRHRPLFTTVHSDNRCIPDQSLGLTRHEEPPANQSNFTYSRDKAVDVLGIKYRKFDETMKDTWDEFVRRGFVTRDGKPNF